MPCFLAGKSVAHSAAHLLSVPLFEVSHQQGHIAAAALSAGRLDLLDSRFLAWHLSGGTSELLYVECGADGLPDCTCIGGTTDLAAGQLLDRAGALLELPFPSGAALDELALTAEPQKGFRPRVTDCRFSLSGMQNQVENKFKTEKPEDMARFALETVANAVIKATEQAKERYDVPVLCAGGVMASRVIRARMEKRFGSGVSFAEPTLSGDNAVGVAVLAARLYRKTGADGQRVCRRSAFSDK